MSHYKVFIERYDAIEKELQTSRTKHPNWPRDILHQIAIVNKESGKATRAALQYAFENESIENVKKELIQTAAMCIRMLENLED